MRLAELFRSRFFVYLAPTLLAPIVSFLMVPIITYYVSPAEFGDFAILSSAVSIVSLTASLGYGFLWSYFSTQSYDKPTINSYTTTLAAAGFLAAAAGAFIFFLLLPHLLNYLKMELDRQVILILSLSAFFHAIWMQTSDLLILDKKAKAYSGTVICASLVSAGTNLAGFLLFKCGAQTLFYSMLAGSVVYVTGAYVALSGRTDVTGISSRWLKDIVKLGLPTIAPNFMESFQSFLERSILGALASASSVGFLAHSQAYKSLLNNAIKAVSRTIWPTSLEEAKQGCFEKTTLSWSAIALLVGCTGILSAAVGREVIGFITHQRYVDAAPLVTAWCLFCVVQCIGKEDLAVLYSQGRSTWLASAQLGSQVVAVALIYIAVHAWGVWGVVATGFVQNVLLRLLLSRATGRPLMKSASDWTSLACSCAIGIMLLVQVLLIERVAVRIAFGFLTLSALLYSRIAILRQLQKRFGFEFGAK